MGRHVAWIVWSLLAVLMMGCGNDVPREFYGLVSTLWTRQGT